MAVMFGPPTLGGCCWWVWHTGRERMLRAKGFVVDSVGSSALATSASVASLPLTYFAQLRFVCSHFDEGGSLSLDWKKGVDNLGEPLKIKTWTQFYRAAGPPVFSRTAAIILSFYCAGQLHGWVAARQQDPPPPPPKKPKKEAKGRK